MGTVVRGTKVRGFGGLAKKIGKIRRVNFNN